jgi:anti-sigma factor RsiW
MTDDRVQDYMATLAADNALLKATEQRLRRLLEGADQRAVAHGEAMRELAAQAADVAGEREANAALTAELEKQRRPLKTHEIERLWLMRTELHGGELMPQLRDFARAIERAHGIGSDA